MPAFVHCFLCGTGRARHRIPLKSLTPRWVCAFCDPAPAADRTAERMADALVLAGDSQPISVAHYARVCEILEQARFDRASIVAHAPGAIAAAARRLRAGELASLMHGRGRAAVAHG